MSTTTQRSRTTSFEEYLDRAILTELRHTNATAHLLAEAIGGVPVLRDGVGWMGYHAIDGRAVAPRLAILKARGLVRGTRYGDWELTAKGFWNGYWTAALLESSKGIRIVGIGRHSGRTSYRIEQDGKTIGYVRRAKPSPKRTRRGRQFEAYGVTKRGEIRARPLPRTFHTTVAAAVALGGLS